MRRTLARSSTKKRDRNAKAYKQQTQGRTTNEVGPMNTEQYMRWVIELANQEYDGCVLDVVTGAMPRSGVNPA